MSTASELSLSSAELSGGATPAPEPRKRASVAVMFAIMLPVAAVVLVADRVTKNLAQNKLSQIPGGSVPVIDDFLRFSLSHNTGAAFGVLQNQSILYLVIALVVMVVSVGYYRYLPRTNVLLTICLGMQLGGAIGNLVDRFQHVYVVDFIDVGVGSLRWPWFNVADSCIVVGILVLAGYLMLHPEAERK